MSYRRPGIEVIQEFQAVLPTFGLPTLPNLVIGEAYQILTKDVVGIYDGNPASYPYVGLEAGNIVDLADPDTTGETLIEYPVRIFIEDGRIVFLPSASSGITTEESNVFEDSNSTAFQDVKVGDKVIIESGDDSGEYTVIELDPTNFSKIKLNQELSATGSSIQYRVERDFESVEIPRSTSGVTIDEDSVDLPAALEYNGYSIVDGDVRLNYRALKPSLASNVRVFNKFGDLESVFGVGQVVPENPLAFGISLALQNTTTSVGGLGLSATFMTDAIQAHQKALDVCKQAKIQGEDVYCLIPLTQEPVIHQLYDVHVEQLSQPSKKKERIGIVNRKLRSVTTIADEATTSEEFNVTEARPDAGEISISPSPLSSTFTDTTTTNAFANVQVGDILRIAEGGPNDGDHVVTEVVSNSEITVETVFTSSQSSIDYQIVRKDGLWRDGKTFYDSNANFISEGVSAGHYLEVRSASGGTSTLVGRFLIATVNNNKKLTLAEAKLGAPYNTVKYEINRDFTIDEEASYIAGYASSFANRRLVVMWPDIAETPVSGVVKDLPGFYFGTAIGAMVSGLPAHQGFTNLTIAGFIGFKNSSDRFNEDQLDVIASGGVMILDQEVEEAPLYIRHQLTTDLSAIAYQELSITKNVDSISKQIRKTYKPYVGIYNINDSLVELLQTIGNGLIDFLVKSKLPRIGAPLRAGNIISLVESVSQPDTLETEWDISIPYPFNNLKVTLLI